MVKALLITVSVLAILISTPNYAEELPPALSKEECEASVNNIQKSIKKHKLNLRKQKARSLSNIEKNIIRTMLADLNSKVSVQSCLEAEGKTLEGYQCMLEHTDIKDCRMDKPNQDSKDS